MSRWMIEKDGTGIEKAGTGIEKSGTGIEKSGTGIEKSGTGIEKAGTGIRRGLLAFTLAALACAGNIQAKSLDPAGSLQIVVNNDTVAVSWIIGDSVFSGVSSLSGSYASLMLTEVALTSLSSSTEITGGGTGLNTQITGGGTGLNTQITGGGTGLNTQITGGGTGLNTQITGGGTGSHTKITGGGTGLNTQITGGGTGLNTQITGGGTGSTILIAGGGTGSEGITVTLPNGTGMSMELSFKCGGAGVTIVDANLVPVVSFENVKVIGTKTSCNSSGGFGSEFRAHPGKDFHLAN